jgi:hypothetical protein
VTSPETSSSTADDVSAAEAALATADSLMEQLAAVDAADVASNGYDAAVDIESGTKGFGGGEPLPLVMQEAHTEQE